MKIHRLDRTTGPRLYAVCGYNTNLYSRSPGSESSLTLTRGNVTCLKCLAAIERGDATDPKILPKTLDKP